MMIYATHDAEGNVTGHYFADTHAAIPEGAKEMSRAQWRASCDGRLKRDIAKDRWKKKDPPSVGERLREVKAHASNRINQARASAINGGLSHGGHQWDSDATGRANLSGLVSALGAGLALPDGFTWRTADNLDVPMQAPDLVALAGAMLEHVNRCYQRSWRRKADIDAATTVEEVSSVVW